MCEDAMDLSVPTRILVEVGDGGRIDQFSEELIEGSGSAPITPCFVYPRWPMRSGLIVSIFGEIFKLSLNGSAPEGIDTVDGLMSLFRKFAEESKELRRDLADSVLRAYVQDFLVMRGKVPLLMSKLLGGDESDGEETAFVYLCENELVPALSQDWMHWFFRGVYTVMKSAEEQSS